MTMVLLLLAGALFGVQQMSEILGISEPEPITILKQKPQKEVAHKQEKEPVIEELKAKQQKANEVERFNFFSELGKKLGEALHQLSRAGLSQLLTLFHDVLNGASDR